MKDLARLLTLLLLGAVLHAADATQGTLAAEALRDPVIIAGTVPFTVAKGLDWESSQVFFRQGWREANPLFAHDDGTALSRGRGWGVIAGLTGATFGMQWAANLTSRTIWGPRRDSKAAKVQRWVVAAAISCAVSYPSFRQWRRNEMAARQQGWK
jgi:hypothetical protein